MTDDYSHEIYSFFDREGELTAYEPIPVEGRPPRILIKGEGATEKVYRRDGRTTYREVRWARIP